MFSFVLQNSAERNTFLQIFRRVKDNHANILLTMNPPSNLREGGFDVEIRAITVSDLGQNSARSSCTTADEFPECCSGSHGSHSSHYFGHTKKKYIIKRMSQKGALKNSLYIVYRSACQRSPIAAR